MDGVVGRHSVSHTARRVTTAGISEPVMISV
jgi:hypothetical protein